MSAVQLDVCLLELTHSGHELLLARIRAMVRAPGVFFGGAKLLLELDAVGGDMVAGRGHLLRPRQFRLQFAKLREVVAVDLLGDRLERVHRFIACLAIGECAQRRGRTGPPRRQSARSCACRTFFAVRTAPARPRAGRRS